MKELAPLDLHGMRHGDVDRIVENWIFKYYPMTGKIITGNSEQMKKIVKDVLDRNEFTYTEGDYFNRGYFTVNT